MATPKIPRDSKRQRVVDADLGDNRHAVFTSWIPGQGIIINAVKPAALPDRGTGLVTTKKVKEGEKLIHIPEKCMIKPSAKLFKRGTDISPQAKLAATLIHLKASDDEIYNRYSEVWPSDHDFASSLAWYGKNLDHLNRLSDALPKTLQLAYARLRHDADHDEQAIRKMLDSRQIKGDIADFQYAWAIANTRSFSWKPGTRKEGVMVICPFLDYMNHTEAGKGCEVSMSEAGYTLIANRNYGVGEEIMATYGAHSNDKLLAHYGFTMPKSSDDSIALDELILPSLSSTQRLDLESLGYLGSYTLSPSTGEICFRTQVALRSTFMTSNEWEYFMGSGDDIASDRSGEVRKVLVGLIEGLENEMRRRKGLLEKAKSEVDGGEERAVLGTLVERWRQIEAGLKEYRNAS